MADFGDKSAIGPCFGADLAAAASSALWGGSAVKWQSLPMNSAIPSEGSMQTSWHALRNQCCANLGGSRPRC